MTWPVNWMLVWWEAPIWACRVAWPACFTHADKPHSDISSPVKWRYYLSLSVGNENMYPISWDHWLRSLFSAVVNVQIEGRISHVSFSIRWDHLCTLIMKISNPRLMFFDFQIIVVNVQKARVRLSLSLTHCASESVPCWGEKHTMVTWSLLNGMMEPLHPFLVRDQLHCHRCDNIFLECYWVQRHHNTLMWEGLQRAYAVPSPYIDVN